MPTAVIVPETALLVPGAVGRGDVLSAVRAAALEAVADLVASRPRRMLLVSPAPASRVVDAAQLCAALTATGISERHLGWPPGCRLAGCPDHDDAPVTAHLAATATAVGLRLLAASGWTGPTTACETAPGGSGTSDALEVDDDTAVLVLGSLSARRDEDAPRAPDPRARGVDADLAAALGSPSPAAIARLAQIDLDLARELDIGGAGPWRLLAQLASGRDVTGRLEAADDSLGVDHRVWTWRWAA